MTDHTSDALASALPDGVSYKMDVAHFQAERLAEAGYVLVHVDDDEQQRRIAQACGDPGSFVKRLQQYPPMTRQVEPLAHWCMRAVPAALADTSAQARHTAATGGGAS